MGLLDFLKRKVRTSPQNPIAVDYHPPYAQLNHLDHLLQYSTS